MYMPNAKRGATAPAAYPVLSRPVFVPAQPNRVTGDKQTLYVPIRKKS